MHPSPQPLRRWPLGMLYFLTLGLDMGLAVWVGWMFSRGGQKYYYTTFWFWPGPSVWLLLAGMGLLALVVGLDNAFRRRVGRALAWLGLSTLAISSCAVAAVPLFMLTMSIPSVGDPTHVDDER